MPYDRSRAYVCGTVHGTRGSLSFSLCLSLGSAMTTKFKTAERVYTLTDVDDGDGRIKKKKLDRIEFSSRATYLFAYDLRIVADERVLIQ